MTNQALFGRRVAVWVLVFALSVGVSGTARANDVGSGFKIGVSRATLGGEVADAANAEAITTLITCVFLRVGVGSRFSVQPEILVTRNGARGDTLGIVGTVRLNYVEIPLLLRYSFLEGNVLIPSVFVGPAFRWRLSADVESDNGHTRSLDSIVRRSDYGLVFGGDIGVPTGGPELNVEFRYMLGLTKIDDSGVGADIKNRAFSVVVGLCFGGSS